MGVICSSTHLGRDHALAHARAAALLDVDREDRVRAVGALVELVRRRRAAELSGEEQVERLGVVSCGSQKSGWRMNGAEDRVHERVVSKASGALIERVLGS